VGFAAFLPCGFQSFCRAKSCAQSAVSDRAAGALLSTRWEKSFFHMALRVNSGIQQRTKRRCNRWYERQAFWTFEAFALPSDAGPRTDVLKKTLGFLAPQTTKNRATLYEEVTFKMISFFLSILA
jgi:hypothetical protein